MKHSLPLALLLGLIVSCGRTSDMEGDDGAGSSGGNGNGATSSGGTGDATTGGTASTGGSTSAGATGGSATHTTGGSPSTGSSGGAATGGETALGGMGGEGGLPMCEQPGYPVPTVTQKLMLTGMYWEGLKVSEQYSYEGPIVTGLVDGVRATFEGSTLNASFQMEAEFARPGQVVDPPLLHQLFTEGQEVNLLQLFELNKWMSAAVLVSVVNVVLLTALSTVMAFLYNVVSSVVGGIYLTLTDD